MTITRESLTQAATHGQPLDHLTAGQVWAAHKLAIPPERLQRPLASHIGILLENVERKARRHFFGGVERSDTDTMIARAYDEQHPPFLRLPILEVLRQGMDEHFPDLKPAGYDDQGQAVYALADIAQALDVPEDELLDHAEQQGMLDQIKQTPAPHRVH
ncbi:MAG: hypothetical protein VYB20_13115 [Pseudomonadota bacterium]|jgi:hypothetical protein|uniref:Uncharacterized protein n=1 Tax=Vreelandella aquamarina TaxID=77097 RepID=A0A1N6GYS9_9GAMM|nr:MULTISPECIES: hypothetical protein [Halomonas]MEC8938128.1 hypothetical protein [Pseudomonadota bacterium]HAO01753.1 hypothetical protein [Halomonas sp.]AYF33628.1 hypothetical protein CUU95_07220 [Halomonas alkaliphila]MCP1303469.1 hypothetical protein [Halomonas sp. R1t8]MCP1330825.1 hypothetical protein [Halomonas sp. R1t4]|tara:strand:- start:1188 stop:1664 length:477 start_codon:yes stop_codon:yes gene_type:complete